jgi:YVTN family beta-propeller protein
MTRHTLFILAVLAFGCSRPETGAPDATPADTAAPPAATRSIPTGPKLFVSNENSGDLSVIDVGTQQVVATIPVGKRPRGIRLSPDGSLIYVALSGSPIAPPGVDEDTLPPADKKADGIGVVSVKDLKLVRTIPGGSDPEMVAVTPDGKRMFIANEDVGEATAIEVETGTVLASFKVGGEPEGVDMRPDGRVVYVTSEEDSQVAVIDAVDLKLLKTFKVGPRPRSTGFLPDGSRAYVPAENGGSISVIDAQAHRLLDTIKLEGGSLVRPMGTAVSPDGKLLFASTGRGKSVVFIDTATNKPIATVEAGERPWGVAVSPDGRTVFTANGPSNDVTFIDVETRKVSGKVKAGERPWGVVYVP